jgi:tetraacyldisaccharide 4'-kinase
VVFCLIRQRFLLWGQKRIEEGAWFLAPFSFLWAIFVFCKNFLYDWGLLSVSKVDCVVVSVGNLVAGGTGKTPFVHLLASQFVSKRVAILSRGYGEIPDEAMLLRRRLPSVQVYVGRDRVKLAKQAIDEGAQLIILDDGFQYRRLYRDFDLVLLGGSDPFGKGHYLPWGFLRDSPRRLRFADAICVSGKTSLQESSYIYLNLKVERILGRDLVEIHSIRGLRVAIFCGIAKPLLFQQTVQDLGAVVVSEWILADHEIAEKKALHRFCEQAKFDGAQALICTEKDFVKLGSEPLLLPIYFIEISFTIREGLSLWENLIAKIDQKIDNCDRYE